MGVQSRDREEQKYRSRTTFIFLYMFIHSREEGERKRRLRTHDRSHLEADMVERRFIVYRTSIEPPGVTLVLYVRE